MNEKRIKALIEKKMDGTSSQEENGWLEKWLDRRSKSSEWDWKDDSHKKRVQEEIFKNISGKVTRAVRRTGKKKIYAYQAAVAALLIMGLVFSFWFISQNRNVSDLTVYGKAVTPGTKTATLQMGNGEVIYLDDLKEGLLSQLDNVEITKIAGGSIQYRSSDIVSADRVVENILSIPRGGQYQVILPDGTKVWLNSETKLIYPTRFVGKERKVKLVGQAYFEVAKNEHQPFIVESRGMDIRVTGTEFNVSAYEDAIETTTTLIEGSVLVYNKEKEKIKLIPGQQAFQKKGTMNIGKRNVDVNNIVSWKKGYFSFDDQSLEEVMNEVSRWYDIDYKIVGKPNRLEKLGGTFSREKSLDELLGYLEQLAGVKINKEERSVVLMY